jgi:hypothetical protein
LATIARMCSMERTAKTEELALRLQDISNRFTEFVFYFVRQFSR